MAAIASRVVLNARAGSEPAIDTRSQFVASAAEAGAAVGLDTTVYLPATTPAPPAVTLANGFGGPKNRLDTPARSLAGLGHIVLVYTARGSGRSSGLIHFGGAACPRRASCPVAAARRFDSSRSTVAVKIGHGLGAMNIAPLHPETPGGREQVA